MIPSFLFNFAEKIPFKPLLRMSGMRLFLPFYHIVSDEPAPHVGQLYPVRTLAQFRADLDWILRHFQPVTLDEVISGKKYNKPVFHLSFDDGLRQCREVIAPVLLEKGIPATFFINPAFIDNKDLMFRYKAGLTAAKEPRFRHEVLKINYSAKDKLDRLATEAKVDFTAFLKEYQPYMTSGQVAELLAQGFDIGAHSMDHPLYSELSPEDQLRQTTDSINFIRNRWAVPDPAFAFPFTDHGVGEGFFEKLPKGTATFGCAGVKKERIAHHFQRLAMEKHHGRAGEIVGVAYLSYLAKKMIGREYAQR